MSKCPLGDKWLNPLMQAQDLGLSFNFTLFPLHKKNKEILRYGSESIVDRKQTRSPEMQINFQINESALYQSRVDRVIFCFHWAIDGWIFDFHMIKHIISQTLVMLVFKTESGGKAGRVVSSCLAGIRLSLLYMFREHKLETKTR